MPRSYPPEYRRRVIDLIESGQSVAAVAAGLEVSDQTIYNWWNRHLIDTGRKPGVTSTDNAALKYPQHGQDRPMSRRSTGCPTSFAGPTRPTA